MSAGFLGHVQIWTRRATIRCQEQLEALDASASHDIRHLAVIDMKGCTCQQLPLTNSQLFRVAELHTASASHGCETELELIQAAQQRLHEFAIHPANAFAGFRFLIPDMRARDAEAVQATTAKIVDDLVKLMSDNELGHVWTAWHPNRFAAVAAYAYVFLADPAKTTSKLNWMVDPKRIYIPIDQIHSLPTLASHCPTLIETLGVDAVQPRVQGIDAVPSRAIGTIIHLSSGITDVSMKLCKDSEDDEKGACPTGCNKVHNQRSLTLRMRPLPMWKQ